MNDQSSVTELLKDCGLRENQAQVLSVLMKLDALPATLLAKRCNLKRTTVYSLLEELEVLGMVQRIRRGNTSFFSTIPSEYLEERLAHQGEQSYHRMRTSLKGISTILQEQREKGFVPVGKGVEIDIVRSKQTVLEQMYATVLQGNYQAIFNPAPMLSPEGKIIVGKFLNQSAKRRQKIQEIITLHSKQSQWYLQRIKNPFHEIRFLPQLDDFSIDFILTDEGAVISSYRPNAEVALRLRQEEILASFRSLFKRLWCVAEPCQ